MHEHPKGRSPRRRIASLTAALALASAVGMAIAPAAGAAFTAPSTADGPLHTAVGSKPVAAVVVEATTITLEVPTGSVLGNDVTVTALLRTKGGAVLAGEHLSLLLDGNSVRSDKSDATGKVALVIAAKDLTEARAYAVEVTFSGAHGLAASSATATLTILSAAIQIRTVPARCHYPAGSRREVLSRRRIVS